ncbi:hypothetical protein ACQKG5_13795, partial [Serratia bockelmannii]
MTTIVSVRRNGQVVIGGDGQATLGNTVMKGNVKKVRRLYNDKEEGDASSMFRFIDEEFLAFVKEEYPETMPAEGHVVEQCVDLTVFRHYGTDRTLLI